MARGFNYTAGERVVTGATASEPSGTKSETIAVSKLMSDGNARKGLQDLTNSIKLQQSKSTNKWSSYASAYDKSEIKTNKLKIASIVKKLPSEIREAIELNKNETTQIFRGVSDRKITEDSKWKNGKFVYGFSKDRDVSVNYGKRGEEPLVISAENIESFGGSIDVEKLYKLIKLFNDAKLYEFSNKKISSKSYKETLIDGMNPFSFEKEVILYDIKFKKTDGKFYI